MAKLVQSGQISYCRVSWHRNRMIAGSPHLSSFCRPPGDRVARSKTLHVIERIFAPGLCNRRFKRPSAAMNRGLDLASSGDWRLAGSEPPVVRCRPKDWPRRVSPTMRRSTSGCPRHNVSLSSVWFPQKPPWRFRDRASTALMNLDGWKLAVRATTQLLFPSFWEIKRPGRWVKLRSPIVIVGIDEVGGNAAHSRENVCTFAP